MRRLLFALLLAVTSVAACGGPSYSFHGTPYNPVIPAPELAGVQAGNVPFRLQDLKEKVKLVFFGYTSCPDVCPLTLANVQMVYNMIPANQQKNVAGVFVSVDPERDTPERLAEFVHAFNPAFYGVHVPADQLEQTKQDYAIFSARRDLDSSQSAAGYLVDHTAVIMLVDKDDQLRAIYPTDAPAADIAADVEYLLKQ